jgi:hypothetical protein
VSNKLVTFLTNWSKLDHPARQKTIASWKKSPLIKFIPKLNETIASLAKAKASSPEQKARLRELRSELATWVKTDKTQTFDSRKLILLLSQAKAQSKEDLRIVFNKILDVFVKEKKLLLKQKSILSSGTMDLVNALVKANVMLEPKNSAEQVKKITNVLDTINGPKNVNDLSVIKALLFTNNPKNQKISIARLNKLMKDSSAQGDAAKNILDHLAETLWGTEANNKRNMLLDVMTGMGQSTDGSSKRPALARSNASLESQEIVAPRALVNAPGVKQNKMVFRKNTARPIKKANSTEILRKNAAVANTEREY